METTRAILLRKRKLSDTSLIVSWYTESLGKLETVAKGARRPTSVFAGKLDLFFQAEIQLRRSRRSCQIASWSVGSSGTVSADWRAP